MFCAVDCYIPVSRFAVSALLLCVHTALMLSTSLFFPRLLLIVGWSVGHACRLVECDDSRLSPGFGVHDELLITLVKLQGVTIF